MRMIGYVRMNGYLHALHFSIPIDCKQIGLSQVEISPIEIK